MADLFFGSDDARELTRRSMMLHRIAGGDRDLAWYGRWVALTWSGPDCLNRFEALIRLQGASPLYWIPSEEEASVIRALEGAGLKPDLFENVCSAGNSVAAARVILATQSLPDDLEVVRLGPESPDTDLTDFADLALSEGVLPPPSPVLRGAMRRGVCLLARSRHTGDAVSTAVSIEMFHPEGPRGDHAFWGMLTTVPARRGEKIALILGAMAMTAMEEEHGLSRFMTGVRAANASSLALCAKVDMVPTGYRIVAGMDPSQFSNARVTA